MSLPRSPGARIRTCLLVIWSVTWGPALAHADVDGPVALVVNTDVPALTWARVQAALAQALGQPVIASDDPGARARRGLLTVTWRQSRQELAVTYENPRGIISRVVPGPPDVDNTVAVAVALAVNLVRDQAAEVLGGADASSAARAVAAPTVSDPAASISPREPAPARPAPAAVAAPSVAVTAAAPAARPAPPRFMLALLAGTGFGWASGQGDVNVNTRLDGGGSMAWSRIGHLAPEFGMFVAPLLLLSVQARLQYVTGTTDLPLPAGPHYDSVCGGDHLCSAPRSALAGFVKATLFGRGKHQTLGPYLSLGLGGGAIRHVKAAPGVTSCGPVGTQTCIDTFTGGPWLAAPGAGLHYPVAGDLDLVAAIELQLGAPTFTFNVDANIGVAVRF